MRRIVVLLLCGCVSGSAAVVRAQQTPTFRSSVSLVTLDVSVLDRDAKPVPGLTADDFEIKLNGHLQPVRVLTYEAVAPTAAPSPVAVNGVPIRETTNAAPTHEPRLFVLLLDDLSISPSRGKGMFFAADRFIAALPTSDIVGFTTTSTTATINPTLDHAAVQAGVRHVAGEFIDPREIPPMVNVGIGEALDVVAGDGSALARIIARECRQGAAVSRTDTCPEDVERKTRSLGAMLRQTASRQIDVCVNVINAMRPVPGLKQLVLLSDGLGVSRREIGKTLEPIAHAAAAAGVQVSVLMQEPDMVSVTDLGSGANEVRRDDNQALTSGVQTVADITGGNFYRVVGTPDPFFSRVAASSSAIYHLGVEAPPGGVPGKDFALVARVKRAGVTVHANRQAVAPVPLVAVPVEDQLHAAVAKGLPFYGVPISVATVLRRGNPATQLDLGANVEIPATVQGPLTVVFGLVDAAGTLRTGRKTVAPALDGNSYRLSLSLPVPPGQYQLRFAVADASGHVGSIASAVKAQLGRVGPFLTSDLLTSWNGPDGKPEFLALERVPAAATGLRAFLELYRAQDAAVPSNVEVRWSLLENDTRTLDERVVVAASTGDALKANTQFALDKLLPGTYVIRATIVSGGSVVGTVSTTIRKLAKPGGSAVALRDVAATLNARPESPPDCARCAPPRRR